MSRRILVVDDDGHIREVVRFALEQAGFEVVEAADGEAALELAESEAPDLVVLDVVLPGEDGLAICRRLRERGLTVPILFLTSRTDELDRVLGLELGGDDYVTKPFSPRELVARIKAILRRARPGPPVDVGPIYRVGPLGVDEQRHRAWWADVEVSLTATEQAILVALARRPGRVFSRDELVERAWGSGHHVSDRTVDSHVRGIRRKFARAGGDPVETVHGVGYRLREAP